MSANLQVSLPGLTRQSIALRENVSWTMDARVKPAHDDRGQTARRHHLHALTSFASLTSNLPSAPEMTKSL